MEQDYRRLSFIAFFEIFRQVVGHCPSRGEAMHRVWLENRNMMKRLCKDARKQQRRLRRRERRLRTTVRSSVPPFPLPFAHLCRVAVARTLCVW